MVEVVFKKKNVQHYKERLGMKQNSMYCGNNVLIIYESGCICTIISHTLKKKKK